MLSLWTKMLVPATINTGSKLVNMSYPMLPSLSCGIILCAITLDGLFTSQDLTGKVRKTETHSFAIGGLADIWMGELL